MPCTTSRRVYLTMIKGRFNQSRAYHLNAREHDRTAVRSDSDTSFWSLITIFFALIASPRNPIITDSFYCCLDGQRAVQLMRSDRRTVVSVILIFRDNSVTELALRLHSRLFSRVNDDRGHPILFQCLSSWKNSVRRSRPVVDHKTTTPVESQINYSTNRLSSINCDTLSACWLLLRRIFIG